MSNDVEYIETTGAGADHAGAVARVVADYRERFGRGVVAMSQIAIPFVRSVDARIKVNDIRWCTTLIFGAPTPVVTRTIPEYSKEDIKAHGRY